MTRDGRQHASGACANCDEDRERNPGPLARDDPGPFHYERQREVPSEGFVFGVTLILPLTILSFVVLLLTLLGYIG